MKLSDIFKKNKKSSSKQDIASIKIDKKQLEKIIGGVSAVNSGGYVIKGNNADNKLI